MLEVTSATDEQEDNICLVSPPGIVLLPKRWFFGIVPAVAVTNTSPFSLMPARSPRPSALVYSPQYL